MPHKDLYLTEPVVDQLEAAFATYRATRHRVDALAPHAERRFFRTQDVLGYTRDRRRILILTTGAVRRLQATLRRLTHRHAELVTVGESSHGMPTCFLARVPKAPRRGDRENGNAALEPETYLLGRPLVRDVEGRALVRERMRVKREKLKLLRADAKLATLKRKMTVALTRARFHLAAKDEARHAREAHASGTPEYDRLAKESYLHHAQYARCWRRAEAYRDRLARIGLKYDLSTLETPSL